MIAWYKFLRKMNHRRIDSITWAWYNNKYWLPEGEWPYGMKRKG